MSERYSFIPTIEVVRNLKGKGWLPVRATEQRTRIEEKVGFTKHMIRLRQSDAPIIVGEVIPEVVIINAHDGGAAYQAMAGLFRLICSNGLMVDEGTIEKVSVRHSGDVIREVAYAAKYIAKEVPRLAKNVKRMQDIILTPDQQRVFATAALDIRYERNDEGRSTAPIEPTRLLIPRRYEDRKSNLWTTFNTIQENLIKGGIRGYSRSETNRRISTREVKSVSEDVRLNRALWTLATEMTKLTKRRKAA
ncbi:DUF932 domain-containing protein [Geobacter sp. AOG1]|uniref:DUF932 domain-containing protein n=1 Tax=Geobacter sp. AOG1 TaxID=1566346 RepID=UPI001CC3B414|nr:DUF932 domain-containing protein [Geobacter sp. AOG1]